jgi:hypothetical protein
MNKFAGAKSVEIPVRHLANNVISVYKKPSGANGYWEGTTLSNLTVGTSLYANDAATASLATTASYAITASYVELPLVYIDGGVPSSVYGPSMIPIDGGPV